MERYEQLPLEKYQNKIGLHGRVNLSYFANIQIIKLFYLLKNISYNSERNVNIIDSLGYTEVILDD